MTSVVILASGYSSRMKQEKLLLPVEGEPMIKKVAKTVSESEVFESILIYRRIEVKKETEKFVTKSVFNPFSKNGQSAAIRLGIQNLHAESTSCLFVPGDQPFLTAGIINALIRMGDQFPQRIIIPVYQGRRGSPVLFPSRFWTELALLEGDTGGKKVIEAHEEEVTLLPLACEKANIDIDTWNDYEKMIIERSYGR